MTRAHRTTIRLLASFGLLLSIVACGRGKPVDDAPPPPVGSPPPATVATPEAAVVRTSWGRALATAGCDVRPIMGQCVVIHRGDEDELEGFCRDVEGVMLPDGCPTEGRLGRCDPPELEDTMYLGHYDYAVQTLDASIITAPRARSNCVEIEEGVWHPQR